MEERTILTQLCESATTTSSTAAAAATASTSTGMAYVNTIKKLSSGKYLLPIQEKFLHEKQPSPFNFLH